MGRTPKSVPDSDAQSDLGTLGKVTSLIDFKKWYLFVNFFLRQYRKEQKGNKSPNSITEINIFGRNPSWHL